MHAQARPEKCRLFSCFHDFEVEFLEAQPHITNSQIHSVCFAIWALHQYEHSYWNSFRTSIEFWILKFKMMYCIFPKGSLGLTDIFINIYRKHQPNVGKIYNGTYGVYSTYQCIRSPRPKVATFSAAFSEVQVETVIFHGCAILFVRKAVLVISRNKHKHSDRWV